MIHGAAEVILSDKETASNNFFNRKMGKNLARSDRISRFYGVATQPSNQPDALKKKAIWGYFYLYTKRQIIFALN